MLTYIVIGICIFLLLLVVYISAKPISMGIEARRNIKDSEKDGQLNDKNLDEPNIDDVSELKISDEISKLNDLKVKGILTEEEYNKAKKKIVGLSRFNFFFYKFWHFILIFNILLFFTPFSVEILS